MSVLFPGESDSLHVRLFSVGYIELGEWWTHADHIRTMWRLCRADDGGASLFPPAASSWCHPDWPSRPASSSR